MMSILMFLVVIQLGVIFLRFTLLGKIISTVFKISYKLTREVLLMNYSIITKIYRHVNKKHKQRKIKQVNTLKKAVGAENVIDLSKVKVKRK